MSDDEMPPPQGIEGMGEDLSDDDGPEDDYSIPKDLPDGVKKDILKEAVKDNWQKPKQGDEVTVHYVGMRQPATGASVTDIELIDSTRKREEPFVFILGKGEAIKGLDLGVASMRKGELARFTLSKEYATGDAGCVPQITSFPDNTTTVFEVELISWAVKDDVSGDAGVIKTILTEGSGWKSPKEGDEVLISVTMTKEDGTVILSKEDLEYVLGSGSLGACDAACDMALKRMKHGEESSLKCSKDYGSATVQLTLKEMFETTDVSPQKDKTMIKKQVKAGEGFNKPKPGEQITLSVEAVTDGVTAVPGFSAKVLKLVAGNGEVCDVLEFALAEMKTGERAIITAKVPSLCAEERLGLKDVAADKVVFTMELQHCEKAKETYEMDEGEKLEYGTSRKGVATSLFKAGRLHLALLNYKKVVDTFSYIDAFKEEESKEKAKDLKKTCELNKAACHLKLKEYIEAKKACDTVLKDDSQNVKAIYRHAQAELALKNFPECIVDCKRVLELDAQNRDARALWKQAIAGQKEEDKKSKGLFANMCKALGKGPIPEPFKEKKREDDMDDEDDEVDEQEANAADEEMIRGEVAKDAE